LAEGVNLNLFSLEQLPQFGFLLGNQGSLLAQLGRVVGLEVRSDFFEGRSLIGWQVRPRKLRLGGKKVLLPGAVLIPNLLALLDSLGQAALQFLETGLVECQAKLCNFHFEKADLCG
jgi:hypothetical protein